MRWEAEHHPPVPVNKPAIGRAFGRAAKHYEQYATLQQMTGDRLLTLSDLPANGQVLDAGCGSGRFSRYFSGRGYQVTALDISAEMLRTARDRDPKSCYLQADIDALPVRRQSFDIIWSNLALQWSADLRKALGQLRLAVNPGGSLRFSTVVAGSLPEVNQAWQAVDNTEHVNRFLSAGQIARAAEGYGIRLYHEQITLRFPTVRAALWSLKGVGASHLHQRDEGLPLTRQRLALLDTGWPKDSQGYRLSYQIVYGVSE
ncbi:malonyl-ACP O-methyltransferase BioC [Tatumella sp. UBA2305]|uniref:malonyl-ACP O-methyltransferase BioC n=1 Tax=Tatumella sp. UBA2305 TaxID=1947647 RepID=UPI0025F51BB8|nr:malonyl-ACP O-methyltransferase BioC [Tatumella sp. UBA2305]